MVYFWSDDDGMWWYIKGKNGYCFCHVAETKNAWITVFRGIWLLSLTIIRRCPRGVMVKAVDWGIVVREFALQSRYYVHFRANTLGKGMNPLILSAMGKIVPLPMALAYQPTTVDMPLNKETEPNLSMISLMICQYFCLSSWMKYVLYLCQCFL